MDHKEEVNLDTLENLDKVRATRALLKKKADKQIIPALEEIGFHLNTWLFEPRYIRYLLFTGTVVFSIFSLVSHVQKTYTIFGNYFWMFLCYACIFGGIGYFWYYNVEHGGGIFLFSGGWKDSYVVTDTTSSNYLVTVYIGHDGAVKAKIPYNTFTLDKDEVDMFWLADELEEQFDMGMVNDKE